MSLSRKYLILTWLTVMVVFLSGASATNSVPQGSHDGMDQSQHSPACWAYGFAVNPDNLNSKVRVRVLSDGEEVARTIANRSRQNYAGVCPDGKCAFEFYLWDRITPGKAHTITVQAQDVQTNQWVNLANTPRQLKCFTFELKVLDLEKGTVTPVPTDLLDYGFNPSWSPGGDKIAFGAWSFKKPQHPALFEYADGVIRVVDLATCKTQLLEGTENGGGAAWSPDGRTIAFHAGGWLDAANSIYLVPASGGVPTLLRTDAMQADWSPNGSRIVFYQPSDSSVRTIGINDYSETVVTFVVASTPASNWAYPTWSPDGAWVGFNDEAGNIFKIRVDAQGNPVGLPVQVTANPRPEADACWSVDSDTLFFQSEVSIKGDPLLEHFDLWAVSASGGRPAKLTELTGQGVNVGCWRNGNRIAYAGINDGSSERGCRAK